MATSTHVKRGDDVVVISGSNRGRRGKVLRVLREAGRVVVEGVNLVTKAERKSPKNPEGGLIKREGAIHLSNVMLASVYDASPRRKAAKTQ
jgi:large subunit ribosomal protein L24